MKLQSKDYIFVGIQFVLFFCYLLKVQLFKNYFTYSFTEIGLFLSGFGILLVGLALLQLNKNISPFPSPKSNSILIQNGLFKYIRHPIYTGILSIFIGFGLYTQSFYKIGISLMLLILFYFKTKYEEKRLSLVFSNYSAYKKKTGRFIPKIKKTNSSKAN